MKLTVYDKSNSHPALTYKGKRIITVCRDGSMYLSRILSRELSLHAGKQAVYRQGRRQAQGLVHVRLG